MGTPPIDSGVELLVSKNALQHGEIQVQRQQIYDLEKECVVDKDWAQIMVLKVLVSLARDTVFSCAMSFADAFVRHFSALFKCAWACWGPHKAHRRR